MSEKTELDILPYIEPHMRENVAEIRQLLSTLPESRTTLALDSDLHDLAPLLAHYSILTVLVSSGLSQDLRRDILCGRILVTKNHKDYVRDATSYNLKIIATEEVVDSELIAKLIHYALIDYDLGSNRSSWILFLKADDQHQLKSLPH